MPAGRAILPFLCLGLLGALACADGAQRGLAPPRGDGPVPPGREAPASGSVQSPGDGRDDGVVRETLPGGDPREGERGSDPAGAAPVEAGGARGSEATVVKPEHVRGIYLNAWTAGSARRREALLGLAGRTEINTFVIDIKDASGYVSHDSQVPLAREVGATNELRIRDLPGLLRRLGEEGVYPIARIVVTKDPILAAGRPDLAIQDSAGGVWLDQDGVPWLNFYDTEVWDYHLDLALEMARAGFPEIQWDYLRFPDAPEDLLARAVFPGAGGRTKAQAVRDFLGYAREALDRQGVLMTADVFGVTTSYRRDVGIGQLWESFIDQVDVALPMVYPSHYWAGSFGFQRPNAYPYEIVRRALRDGLDRSAAVEGAGTIRPWLQDFTLGDPPYGAPEVRAQIQAAYDVGIAEWILWNPGSRYTEAALIPERGLPTWLEPVMRVGGEVVPLSRRFEVLGEEPPPGVVGPEGRPLPTDSGLPRLRARHDVRSLKAVPLPDTSRGGGDSGRPGAEGG